VFGVGIIWFSWCFNVVGFVVVFVCLFVLWIFRFCGIAFACEIVVFVWVFVFVGFLGFWVGVMQVLLFCDYIRFFYVLVLGLCGFLGILGILVFLVVFVFWVFWQYFRFWVFGELVFGVV